MVQFLLHFTTSPFLNYKPLDIALVGIFYWFFYEARVYLLASALLMLCPCYGERRLIIGQYNTLVEIDVKGLILSRLLTAASL